MRTVNWRNLQLDKQCGVCIYYNQKVVDDTKTARGNCKLSGIYKQRTDSCLKFRRD